MAESQSGEDRHRQAIRENSGALNWLNFFLADVKDGLGPFLAIFLMSSQHWDAGRIGAVLSIAGVATVIARGPAGAFVDAVSWKRTLIVISASAVAAATVIMAVYPQFWPIAVSQAVVGVADAIFPLAITAISLGIVGRKGFTHRVGRNEAWNHAGNVATAILAGAGGYYLGQSAVLWMIAALALASVAAVYRIDPNAIDHNVARGEDDGQPNSSTLFMAACIIAAQLVMVLMALLVGRKADDWGRKPLFLACFAILPVRGLLFALADDPYSVVAIQLLDGVGAGIFGALFYIVISDFTRGSGRFNLAQGASAACWGLGAALSNVVAGAIVNAFGYSAAFFFLAACAAGAFAIYWFAVPESRDFQRPEKETKSESALAHQGAGV